MCESNNRGFRYLLAAQEGHPHSCCCFVGTHVVNPVPAVSSDWAWGGTAPTLQLLLVAFFNWEFRNSFSYTDRMLYRKLYVTVISVNLGVCKPGWERAVSWMSRVGILCRYSGESALHQRSGFVFVIPVPKEFGTDQSSHLREAAWQTVIKSTYSWSQTVWVWILTLWT